jgi:hypothetical protein
MTEITRQDDSGKANLNIKVPYLISEAARNTIASLDLVNLKTLGIKIPYETPSFNGISAAGVLTIDDQGNISTEGVWLYVGIPVGTYFLNEEGGESCSAKYALVYSCLTLKIDERTVKTRQCVVNPFGKDKCEEITVVSW